MIGHAGIVDGEQHRPVGTSCGRWQCMAPDTTNKYDAVRRQAQVRKTRNLSQFVEDQNGPAIEQTHPS